MTAGCSTSWRRGPMEQLYVTLSNRRFHLAKCTEHIEVFISFPALQGGLQCGWRRDVTIPSTFTVGPIHRRTTPFLRSDPQRTDQILGAL